MTRAFLVAQLLGFVSPRETLMFHRVQRSPVNEEFEYALVNFRGTAEGWVPMAQDADLLIGGAVHRRFLLPARGPAAEYPRLYVALYRAPLYEDADDKELGLSPDLHVDAGALMEVVGAEENGMLRVRWCGDKVRFVPNKLVRPAAELVDALGRYKRPGSSGDAGVRVREHEREQF